MNCWKNMLFFLAIVSSCTWTANAQESSEWYRQPDPIAIRRWSKKGFTVETMWDLHIGVGIPESVKEKLPKPLDAELEQLADQKQGMYVLRRDANTAATKLKHSTSYGGEEFNNTVMLVHSTSSKESGVQEFGATRIVTGFLDVHFFDSDGMAMVRRNGQLGHRSRVDVPGNDVLVAVGEEFTEELLLWYARSIRPVVMIVNEKYATIGKHSVESIAHNTVLVTPRKRSQEGKKSGYSQHPRPTRFVSLGTEPYQMSKELAELFERKEVAQKATMEVFSGLSVRQMNFKPSNGSHTPRWNAEHMMGRELLFFSQIYNAVDSTAPVLNLNPKQMPEDYEFAHPDWTGMEEARQIQRVQNFTRRFAYLLDGMDLDKKAKGSQYWTPRKLLQQMERHYNEHTANVIKKTKLEDWPKK